VTAALAISPCPDLMVNHNSLGEFRKGNYYFSGIWTRPACVQINKETLFCALFSFFSLGYKLSPSTCDRHIWLLTLMGEEMDLTGKGSHNNTPQECLKRRFLSLSWKTGVLREHPKQIKEDNMLDLLNS
jgi:hypothetical protein